MRKPGWRFTCDQRPSGLKRIRVYQEHAISRMFTGNRAKSGIIVLPCGAGKTLVGIMAIDKIKHKTLVMCINNLTVKQLYRQIEMFSTMDMKRVFKFSSDDVTKKIPDLTDPCIVISTYTMISKSDELRSFNKFGLLEGICQCDISARMGIVIVG